MIMSWSFSCDRLKDCKNTTCIVKLEYVYGHKIKLSERCLDYIDAKFISVPSIKSVVKNGTIGVMCKDYE